MPLSSLYTLDALFTDLVGYRRRENCQRRLACPPWPTLYTAVAAGKVATARVLAKWYILNKQMLLKAAQTIPDNGAANAHPNATSAYPQPAMCIDCYNSGFIIIVIHHDLCLRSQ